MAFPNFYHPDKIGTLYQADFAAAIEAGARANLRPAAQDKRRVMLLLVDMQVDFIHPDGTLAVPGAVDDTRRTIEWLYHNMQDVTAIAASLDSHTPMQIFYPTWWADAQGNHPDPFTLISGQDLVDGKWKPLIEPKWSIEYVHKLEQQAKKVLTIWPFHTMIGTAGHALVPTLSEAITYHSAARRAQPTYLTKGSIAKTEHYSIMEPEVKVPEHPLGGMNTHFLDMLATYDLIYMAGQAKSHCVLETTTSLMNYFKNQPDVISRLRFLIDATSSVVHPEVNFDALANQKLNEYAQQGLSLVTTADPIG